MEDMKPEKLQRFFTQADYEAGLCDKNGIALPGGPIEPPKRPIKDSVPTKAQQALAPEPAQPVDNQPLASDPNFDPQKVDAKPAETGLPNKVLTQGGVELPPGE